MSAVGRWRSYHGLSLFYQNGTKACYNEIYAWIADMHQQNKLYF